MVAAATVDSNDLSIESQRFYRDSIRVTRAAGIPMLVGGAYSLAQYTGVTRHTKDFDVFVRPADAPRVLDVFAAAGYRTELTFPHWLGKVFFGEDFVDVIFSSGNGVAKVDDLWFAHATRARFLGEDILLCPPEETIWSKAFVMERERFDGADILHLIRACGSVLDWSRLVRRFGPHGSVLLAHLVLFGFVYPSARQVIPDWVVHDLVGRLEQDMQGIPDQRRVCRGTLLSRTQYMIDVEQWGYADARIDPPAGLASDQARHWTEAGLRGQPAGSARRI